MDGAATGIGSERTRTRTRIGRALVVPAFGVMLLAGSSGAGDPGEGRSADAGKAPPGPVLYPDTADAVETTSEGKRKAADKGLILLPSIEFDPVKHGEPDFSAVQPDGAALAGRDDPARRVYLVQFDRPVTGALQRELAERGVAVLRYVPHRALLLRPPAGAGAAPLAAMAGVRFVGEYEPGYKLSPELFRLLQGPVQPGRRVSIDVSLFPGEPPQPLADAVQRQFHEVRVEHVKQTEPRRVTFGGPEEKLRSLVGAILRDPAVEFVERRLPQELYNDSSVWIGQSYDRVAGPIEAAEPDPKPYALSATVWNRGLLGSGQIVAVADSGLEYGTCFWDDPAHPIVPQSVSLPGPISVDLGHRKVVAVNEVNGGALFVDGSFRHGTHVAGSVAGDNLAHPAQAVLGDAGHDHGDGMAPDAKILLEDVSFGLNSVCLDEIYVTSVQALLEQEYDAGARISTNSWGINGRTYTSESRGIDAAVFDHEGLLVFFAAGNSGATTLNSYAVNKNGIAVGSAETFDGVRDPENLATFSSQGPAADGRTKPDLTAPGVNIASNRFPVTYISNGSDPACAPGTPGVCRPGFGGCYVTDTSQTCATELLSGTSMASPTAAGLGALARQYFTDGFYPTGQANAENAREPSAALLKAVLLNGARNMVGVVGSSPLPDAPSNLQGWGRIMLDDALFFTGDTRRLRVADIPNALGMATGDSLTFGLDVTSSSEPLELTLAWTDPPGFASLALVNDLDLELSAPGGAVYRGNQWTADDVNLPGDVESLPDAPATDQLNNVEGIRIQAPSVGSYRVTIRAADVPGYAGRFTQGFGLVVTGAIADCTAMAPPVLSAEMIVFDDIELSWSPRFEALGYNVYRNSTGCTTPMIPDVTVSVPAGATTYHDTTALPGSTYYYTVRAVTSAAGCETRDSNCVTVVTPPGPTVLSVDPPSGLNNDPTEITVTGLDFESPARVFLGRNGNPKFLELLPVTFVGPTELRATVPVNLLDRDYDVTVENPNFTRHTLAQGFRVAAPLQTALAYVTDIHHYSDPSNDLVHVVDLQAGAVTGSIDLGDDRDPSDVAVASLGGRGVVAEYLPALFGRNGVTLFDPLSQSRVGTIPTSLAGRLVGVAAHPDGRLAYTLGQVSGGSHQQVVSVFDLEAGTLLTEIPIGISNGVDDIKVSPDGARVYAINTGDETVSVIRTSDNVEITRIPIGNYSIILAVSNDSSRLYVGDFVLGEVLVFDTTTFELVDTFHPVNPSGWPVVPGAMTESPDGSTLYVTSIMYEAGMVAIDLATGVIGEFVPQGYQILELHYVSEQEGLWGLRCCSSLVRIDPDTLQFGVVIPVTPYQAGATGMDVLRAEKPAVDAVSPASGCRNTSTRVTLGGHAFQGEVRDDSGAVVQQPTRVFFGGVEATRVTLIGSETLQVDTPSLPEGFVAVEVRNPNGSSATLPSGYRYVACGGGGSRPPIYVVEWP